MGENNLAAGGVGFGLGALLLALTKAKPASAADGGSGDDSAYYALVEALNQEQQTLKAILDATQLSRSSTGNQMAVPNRKSVRSVRVVISAANTPIRLPHFNVPDTFELKIKAGFGNGGQVYVGPSSADSVNVNSSEELVRGEFTIYKIQDAYELWISGNSANDYVTLTAEQ